MTAGSAVSLAVIGALGAAGAGCSGEDPDPDCLQGVCPDWSQTELRPGPCRAGASLRYDFAYDTNNRVRRVEALYYDAFHGKDDPDIFVFADWSYDAAGQPARIVQDAIEGGPVRHLTWSWSEQEVLITTNEVVEAY